MGIAVAPPPDVLLWLRGSGLEIVLLVLGAILLTRFATWLGGVITARIDADAAGDDALVRSEEAKHRHALTQVLTWAALVLVYCVDPRADRAAAGRAHHRAGGPGRGRRRGPRLRRAAPGPGPAGRLLHHHRAPVRLRRRHQHQHPGHPGRGHRHRRGRHPARDPVRTQNGEVIITPNGSIVQLTNLSRGWARAVVDVPVPMSVDVNRVSDILRAVGEEAFGDDELHPLLLDPPSASWACESIEVDQFQVRMVARTLPGKQFDVGRAPAGPHRGGVPARGHPPAHGPGHRSADGPVVTAHRPRRSTWLLMGLFLLVLALYVMVRPVPAGTAPVDLRQQVRPAPGQDPRNARRRPRPPPPARRPAPPPRSRRRRARRRPAPPRRTPRPPGPRRRARPGRRRRRCPAGPTTSTPGSAPSSSGSAGTPAPSTAPGGSSHGLTRQDAVRTAVARWARRG